LLDSLLQENLQKIVGNALLFGYFHHHHNGAVLDGEE